MSDALLQSLGLADLETAAATGRPFSEAELARVLAARHPLAAATLADRARAVRSGLEVTWPWTLRVRAPGLVHGIEDGTRVSHPLPKSDGETLAGIAATEIEMLGALPPDASLGLATELVRSVASARPDLPLRGWTAGEVAALAARERRSHEDVLRALASAGLAALSWRTGCGGEPLFREELDVHRAALAAGLTVSVPVGYRKDGLASFAGRAVAAAALPGIASVVVLPETSETESPLAGTSGIEDWIACSLARLAVGRNARVTADWHVFGWKLGGTLLAAGADDVVAAQSARAWAPPTDDGPRPMNPDRVRAWIVEARRSPSLRDGRFRPVTA